MTTTSSSPEAEAASISPMAEVAYTASGKPKLSSPLRKLLGGLVPANLGVFILWGAIPGILLPNQLTLLDADNKVANVALVTTIGAFAAMLAQPIAGAISDRTRSRFGRRAPWIIGGALIGGLSLVGMAFANTVVTIAIAWTMVQIAYNFVQGPLSAVLPDRVPAVVRGTFASLLGAASMVGAIGGQVLGASLAENVGAAYIGLAGFALLAVTLFVVFLPDSSSVTADLPAFRLRDFLATFWVNPIKHPDFFWAFTGRLLLYTGYFSVIGYNLFLLQDYVGLDTLAAANAMVPVLGMIMLVGILPSIIISGPWSDRVGRRKVFVFASSLIVAAALVVPWVLPTVEGMMIMSFVAGLGFGAFQAVDQALITEVLPSADSYAKDLGVVNIAATLPQTLAPAVGGAIVLLFGYAGLFPVGIVLSVLGAVAVFMIKSVK